MIDISHWGPFMGGLGTLMGGTAAFCGLVYTFANRKGIMTFFHSRTELLREISQQSLRASAAEQRAIAAEQRAMNWERGAEGASFNMNEILRRLEEVEKRAQIAEELIPKFDALLKFTKKLMSHTSALERQLAKAGVHVDSIAPCVPDLLKDSLEHA